MQQCECEPGDKDRLERVGHVAGPRVRIRFAPPASLSLPGLMKMLASGEALRQLAEADDVGGNVLSNPVSGAASHRCYPCEIEKLA